MAVLNLEATRLCSGVLQSLASSLPQIDEVTCGRSPHLSPDQIKVSDYMDRQVTPPKPVTSPTWGPPTLCNQALKRGANGRNNSQQC